MMSEEEGRAWVVASLLEDLNQKYCARATFVACKALVRVIIFYWKQKWFLSRILEGQ